MIFSGIVIGMIARSLDYLPYNEIINIQSINSLYGFWAFMISIIILYSKSNIKASINVFLFLTSMSISYYSLKYIVNIFQNTINEGYLNLLIDFFYITIFCTFLVYLFCIIKENVKYKEYIYAMPIGFIASEIISIISYMQRKIGYVFQFFINTLAIIILYILIKKRVNKYKLILIACVYSVLIYYMYYIRVL